ncbi:MAG: hypothetical protein NTZ68_04240 [Candidatus Dependentiae bacterium]|nr:hypothetical protein [Candidatus Dependentiae bacterium]
MNETRKREMIFTTLIEACHEQDAYSVSMMCIKAKIDYEKIKMWAQEDAKWDYALSLCQSLCECNSEMAALMSRMPCREMEPFMGDIANDKI